MKIKALSGGALVVSAALFLSYCGGERYGWGLSAFTRSENNDPTSVIKKEKDPGTGDDPLLTYYDVTNTFDQPNSSGNFPVDLYFVLDSSGSMSQEFNALKNAITNFLSTMNSQGIVDYCVAAMVGHGGARSGKVQGAVAGQECLCSSNLSNSQIVSKFGQNLQYIMDNHNKSWFKDTEPSDGGEALVYSAHQSFTNSNATTYNMAKGCQRANAGQAYVFVADENDIGGSLSDSNNLLEAQSYGHASANNNCSQNYKFAEQFNSGNDSPRDVDCLEQEFRKEFYSKATPNAMGEYELELTPQKFVNDLKDFNNALPVAVSTISYIPGSSFPTGGENGPLYFGIEIAQLMGNNTITDLADATNGNQSAFNASLSTLADDLSETVSLVTTFHLSDAVCSGYEDDISVKIEGVSTSAFSYVAAGQKVVLDSANDLDFGDEVEIKFTSCE
ncbi:MAG: VWA domain-containing protein [Bdellovibrionales bacterium]|nr:VWA domain-containing protein [Bdellovibrionales bacterium]